MLLVVSRYALLSYGDRRVWVRGPGCSDHCVRVSGYSGDICFEIKFSGRHRGFDFNGVLFNLWPLANIGFGDAISKWNHFFFFSYACHEPHMVNHETASSSTECSRDKPPFSFVRGQDSTMSDIVWVSPQGHRSVSVSHHFLLQAPQCPCSMRKWFSRDHCCRGRSKPGCRIVGSHTRWELTTWADWVESLSLHYLCFFCNFR